MEHLHHFGLGQDPFSNEPDLRYYFESHSHRDAQRRVERGLRQQKGLTLLTGDGGMGKTLLTRRILDSLEEEIFEATLLVMLPGAADATGILQRFARQLGCEEPGIDRASLLGQIYEQLAIVREDGRHAVLMIDDAQIMTQEVFAELSGLLNLEYEDRRLVSMLFVGSPELDTLVQNDPSIMPRVDVRVRLQPLDMEDASAYVAHRLDAVKGNPGIVGPAAMDTLFKYGRGRPRLINTLADNALFEAYLAGRTEIDPSDIERAAADLGIGPDPGTTYSLQATGAVPAAPRMDPPAPAATPAMELDVEPAAPSLAIEPPMPDMALDLDGGPESFALEQDVLPTTPAPTLDLDEGVEDALGDVSVMTSAPANVAPPAPPMMEALEFESELPSGPAPIEEVTLEPVLEAAPLEEDGEFILAEAELTPLEFGDADQLDDAFVELIEE